MERFKIEHFKSENPGKSFPWFRTLTTSEAQRLRENLAKQVQLVQSIEPLDLTVFLDDLATEVEDVDAEAESFNLKSTLSSIGINCKPCVYVSWHRYIDVDQMHLNSLSEYFDYVWYPGPDDIAIFDDTFTWVLEVSHDGCIKVVRFDGHQGPQAHSA